MTSSRIDACRRGRSSRATHASANLGLLKARFRQHSFELHTHPTYVIALITESCERVGDCAGPLEYRL
ncbi:hypothetical protein BQ8482_120008 [Mesorhizobium delmotii]|uniref:Uncharacterized protein n=1 Tax=Mesorhizobium delmotii TaxID=1631247 RepID=A0A2P9AFP7_9HYPH|nr:hypothetical protein BQ8482_120008 [Mesorhizobium delmotii]